MGKVSQAKSQKRDRILRKTVKLHQNTPRNTAKEDELTQRCDLLENLFFKLRKDFEGIKALDVGDKIDALKAKVDGLYRMQIDLKTECLEKEVRKSKKRLEMG